jgi:hypothetical protein
MKKEMGGRVCHPFPFWTPCKAPPGPPQTKFFCPSARQRNGKFLGVHHGPTLIIGCVALPASSGLGPPIDPPIDCPRRGSYVRSDGSATQKRFARVESESACGASDTTSMNNPYSAFSLWMTCGAKTEQKERAARESGPVRSSSESGVQCLPLRCQAHPRRVPCASPSDLDINRPKIPLDIGSPPLCC